MVNRAQHVLAQFQVLTCSSAEAISSSLSHTGNDGLDLVLMDHDPELYLQDLLALQRGNLLSTSCVVLVNRALTPGAPDLLDDSIPYGQQSKLSLKKAFRRRPTKAAKASGTNFSEKKVVPLRECGQRTERSPGQSLEGNKVTPNATREADLRFCGGAGPARQGCECPQTGVSTEDGEPQQILGMVQCHGRDPPSLLLPSDSIKDTLKVMLQRSNQQTFC
ncbi:hypothetical protein DPX16_0928 [Anabarilius grahami]|uniref:Uncharacterized protein n=1 Tax=Anabarilius grahami TaxID=495550 RepID=A0A3N0XEX4_ANAGA|nr:hypothetical protein DPX16_0928 [Anabarilius grahami]